MFQDLFLNFFVFFMLWALSVTGGIAVLLSWSWVEPEEGDFELTPGGHRLMRARELLTAGCIVFWFCTFLAHAFTSWQDHAVILVALFCVADLALIPSAVFSWQGRGSAEWILKIATPVFALASVFVTFILYTANVSSPR